MQQHPDSLKRKIDCSSIARAYGYKPIPDGFHEVSPIDDTLDWETDRKEWGKHQYGAMKIFGEELDHASLPRGLTLRDVSHIPSTKGYLPFKTETWRHSKTGRVYFSLTLSDSNSREIAHFLVSKGNDGRWNLHDRIVSESYRGKGIASRMIEATENCVQAIADATGTDQEIIMEASQLPVLNLFLNQGYEVIDEQKSYFAEVMSKLGSGDPQYILALCEEDFRKNRENRKTWYVFDREYYKRFGDKIWHYNSDENCYNYMKYSIRFTLRKKICARDHAVQSRTSETRARINSAFDT